MSRVASETLPSIRYDLKMNFGFSIGFKDKRTPKVFSRLETAWDPDEVLFIVE